MTLGDAAEPLVHIKDFRMNFGDTTVIKGLSFDVRAGETFGVPVIERVREDHQFAGAAGLYQPTAGTPHIGGKVFEPRDGARLGYLPEERGLYKKEAVLDVMVYFGRLKGLSKTETRTWSVDYLERVGLADKATVRLDKFSGGQQQKVQLGVTIMNDPELLILDEPSHNGRRRAGRARSTGRCHRSSACGSWLRAASRSGLSQPHGSLWRRFSSRCTANSRWQRSRTMALSQHNLGTVAGFELIIAELFIVGLLILRLAVHLFRYGSIEYGKKLSIAGTSRRNELAAR
ncbi:ATP-binding cassette domain-containing protein [Pseudarthrobacter sp. NamE5]|uniref:ATP-binding cassette domain-containing protein n=1 Tax=Pseudarthrobacter sp. NamE5 TaxID=2576839 RepID=UPI001F0FB8E8|nr:ATP-binding cassette domain-containing protein [Pseudarthrobacter sp. NamE5]